MASYDPCLHCRLPDCDEASPRCGLRRAWRIRCRLFRRGRPIPPHIASGAQIYNTAWRIADNAARSERRVQ